MSWSAAVVVAGTLLVSSVPSWAKTAKECNAEYSANKAAIKGTQKKADFIAACKAGTEVIPGGGAAPATPAAAPAPATPAAPAPSPVAPPVPAPKMAPRAPKPAAAPPPAASAAPTGTNEFSTEAQAQGRCPGATVVWLNTKSRIYHFAGTRDYGNTKAGAYMCETDATAAGDRASKTEKHP